MKLACTRGSITFGEDENGVLQCKDIVDELANAKRSCMSFWKDENGTMQCRDITDTLGPPEIPDCSYKSVSLKIAPEPYEFSEVDYGLFIAADRNRRRVYLKQTDVCGGYTVTDNDGFEVIDFKPTDIVYVVDRIKWKKNKDKKD